MSSVGIVTWSDGICTCTGPYECYLRSSAWKLIRREVMTRAGGNCETCKQKRATEVHHLTYDRVGREELSDLLALCHGCHEQADRFREYENGLDTFIRKKYGDDAELVDYDDCVQEFNDWLDER